MAASPPPAAAATATTPPSRSSARTGDHSAGALTHPLHALLLLLLELGHGDQQHLLTGLQAADDL
jgi:hypothetical protein